MPHTLIRTLLGLCLAAAATGLPAQHAHLHGTGGLRMALEDTRLTVEFHSPLDNLVGFEHAPRNDAQRAAVKDMTSRLKRPDVLLKLPPAAACKAAPAVIISPFDAPAGKGQAGGHAELTATYRFDCANIRALDSLEVTLFDAFPRTTALRAEIVGPRGQSAARLSAKRRLVKF